MFCPWTFDERGTTVKGKKYFLALHYLAGKFV